MDTLTRRMTRAAIWSEAGVRIQEVPRPAPGPGELLVRVRLATVCGSDLHTVSGRRRAPSPSILGHEAVGAVVAAGSGARHPVGTRIVWSVTDVCGRCTRCRRGYTAKCERVRKVGHEAFTGDWPLSGSYADHILLPAGVTTVAVPDAVPDAVAAPAGCATATVMAALEAAGDPAGRRILVCGAGMLGVTAVAACAEAGAQVLISDPQPQRRALAARFGALPDTGDPVDIALDFSGSAGAVAGALARLEIGGTLVLAGSVAPGPAVELDPEAVVRGWRTVTGVHNYEPRHLLRAVEFLTRTHDTLPWTVLVADPLELTDIARVLEPGDADILRASISPAGNSSEPGATPTSGTGPDRTPGTTPTSGTGPESATSTTRAVATAAPAPVDLAVVGAGIVGLAHAVEAVERGMRVAVLERDERAVGASVRNFGHLCVTPQTGTVLDYAWAAREKWLRLAEKAGFEIGRAGTLVLARSHAEMGVLEEFAAERGREQVRLLGRAAVADRFPAADNTRTGILGGAHLPLDLRVDPRAVLPALANRLTADGVEFHWNTHVGALSEGVVHTARGALAADAIVHATGHDVDRLFPDLAETHGVRRCRLHMLEVDPPADARIGPAVLTGYSMLRYGGLAATPSAAAVRRDIAERAPETLDAVMNLMLTQRPDGAIVLGDTHHYDRTPPPFDDEAVPDLLLREGARLFGADRLTVRRRWRGLYADSAHTDFLVATPEPGVRVVSVTSGIGMTTALGLAPTVLDGLG